MCLRDCGFDRAGHAAAEALPLIAASPLPCTQATGLLRVYRAHAGDAPVEVSTRACMLASCLSSWLALLRMYAVLQAQSRRGRWRCRIHAESCTHTNAQALLLCCVAEAHMAQSTGAYGSGAQSSQQCGAMQQ